jgi:hypothetical protein
MNPVVGVIVMDCPPILNKVVVTGLPHSSNRTTAGVAVIGAKLCVAEDSLGRLKGLSKVVPFPVEFLISV